MGVLDRVGQTFARWFGSTPPTVPLPAMQALPRTPINQNQALVAAIHSVEALFGVTSRGAGPNNTRYSTYPANDLTPAKIVSAQRQASNGRPWQWAEMWEQVLDRDSDLAGMASQRALDVAGKPFRIVRRRGDQSKLGDSNKSLLESVVFEIDSLDDSIESLLAANGQGWSAEETVWAWRRVHWTAPNGKGVDTDLVCPQALEWVHPKHFEGELGTDAPLLLLSSDRITLPFGKFLFHRGEGNGYWERRGYGRQCVWLSMAKSMSFSDWILFIHRYAMPAIDLSYPGDEAQYAEYKDLYDEILKNLGAAIPAIHPDGVKVNISQPPAGGTFSGPHSAMVDVCNAAMAVRIKGATLTTRIGNVGSFKAADIHSGVEHARELADARKACGTLRRDLFTPFFWFNRFRIAEAIGETPDAIMRSVPESRFRIAKETSPTERSVIVSAAVNDWGLDVDEEQIRDEFDLDKPRPGSRALPGKPTQTTKGGVTTGALEASREGVTPPPDPQDAAPPPSE